MTDGKNPFPICGVIIFIEFASVMSNPDSLLDCITPFAQAFWQSHGLFRV